MHADAANSDYAAVRGPDDVDRVWSKDLDGTVRIGPLEWTINLGVTSSDGDVLYVTSTVDGCHLQALDANTGEPVWCSDALDAFAVASGTLIGDDGTLYVGDGQAMHALRADGSVVWDTPIDGVPLSAQFTPEGRVVFVTHIGVVYVLDRETGAPMLPPRALVPGAAWEPSMALRACARGTEECPSANTVAVDQSTGRIFFTLWSPGAAHAGVRAMRYHEETGPTLEDLWVNESLPGGSGSSPTLSADGTRVYVTDNVDSLHALDAATGSSLWSIPIGDAAGGSPSVSPSGLIIPAGGGSGGVVAIQDDGDSARVAWRRDDLPNRGVVPQADGERAYAVVDRGARQLALVVLDTATGEVLDREDIPGVSGFGVGTTLTRDGAVVVPTIVGGLHVYVAASDGPGSGQR